MRDTPHRTITELEDRLQRANEMLSEPAQEIQQLESTLARTFVRMQRERVPGERQRLWTELLRLAAELEKLDDNRS